MQLHWRVAVAFSGALLILVVVLLIRSWTALPPLSIEARQEGPTMLSDMATFSLIVSNRTSRALHCWVASVKAKNRLQQFPLESGLGLLPFGTPTTNLPSGASSVFHVPVPFGCSGEFRIELGYRDVRQSAVGFLMNEVIRLPVVGSWLSKSRIGYKVVPTEWMSVPNKITGPNAGGQRLLPIRTSMTARVGQLIVMR